MIIEGYKSPVEIYHKQLETELVGNLVNVVGSYGFNIDEAELIRALQYDRNQYDLGYEAGYKAAINNVHVLLCHFPEYNELIKIKKKEGTE